MILTVAEALPTLRSIQACPDSIAWLESLPPGTTAEDAYNQCPNIIWLEWLAFKAHVGGVLQRRELGRVLCSFLDLVLEGKEPELRHTLWLSFRGQFGSHLVLSAWETALVDNVGNRNEYWFKALGAATHFSLSSHPLIMWTELHSCVMDVLAGTNFDHLAMCETLRRQIPFDAIRPFFELPEIPPRP